MLPQLPVTARAFRRPTPASADDVRHPPATQEFRLDCSCMAGQIDLTEVWPIHCRACGALYDSAEDLVRTGTITRPVPCMIAGYLPHLPPTPAPSGFAPAVVNPQENLMRAPPRVGPKNDLSGRRFGKLTVQEYLRGSLWRCACDCGQGSRVLSSDLLSGRIHSCGCGRRGPKAYDLAGNRFGMLTVKEYVRQSRWRCVCDCGRTVEVPAVYLVSGRTMSCGCVRRAARYDPDIAERRFETAEPTTDTFAKNPEPKTARRFVPRVDIKGRRFGKLVALEYLGASLWRCACDCGRSLDAITTDLLSGSPQNCGMCIRRVGRPRTDFTGRRFGKLVALEYVGEKRWRCGCDCGKTKEVQVVDLLLGRMRSCGCLPQLPGAVSRGG